MHVAVARPRAFRKSDQADAGIERRFGPLRHDLQALAGGRVRHGNISEAAHHPAVDRDLEMRFEFEAADKLRNRGVDDEGIENIHVIADEDAGALRIEARRAPHFESHAGESQDIAEESRACGQSFLRGSTKMARKPREQCRPRQNEFR